MSEARRPRAYAKIGGKLTPLLGYSVENNTNFQADTFSATLDAWQQPDGFGMQYWASAGQTNLEVMLGFLKPGQAETERPAKLVSLILAQVDDAVCNATAGTVSLTGRDLTALLIDAKTTTTWPDQTASQIVTKLAAQVGLTTQVTTTKTPVGRYSKSAYAAVGREIPLWDLVSTYAQQEGFDAYVSGTTLYFGPSQAAADTKPFVISCVRDQAKRSITANVETLELRRSLTLAGDMTVTVIGHSLRTGHAVKEVASRQGVKTVKSSSTKTQAAQNYVIRRPNLTAQQALQLAEKTLDDLTRHERTFDATMAEDGTLTTKRKVRITGTGTDFDQDYFLDKISRSFGDGQCEITFSGKNHPVETELAS